MGERFSSFELCMESSKQIQEQPKNDRQSWTVKNSIELYAESSKRSQKQPRDDISACLEHPVVSNTMWEGSNSIAVSEEPSKLAQEHPRYDRSPWTFIETLTFILTIPSSLIIWGGRLAVWRCLYRLQG